MVIAASQSPPYMLGVFLFRVFYNFHVLIMNNFEHRVLRIEPNNQILLCKSVLVGVLNLHLDKQS